MTREFKTPITIDGKAVGPLADTGTPADLGTADRGTSTQAARADHVHNTVTASTSVTTLIKYGA